MLKLLVLFVWAWRNPALYALVLEKVAYNVMRRDFWRIYESPESQFPEYTAWGIKRLFEYSFCGEVGPTLNILKWEFRWYYTSRNYEVDWVLVGNRAFNVLQPHNIVTEFDEHTSNFLNTYGKGFEVEERPEDTDIYRKEEFSDEL